MAEYRLHCYTFIILLTCLLRSSFASALETVPQLSPVLDGPHNEVTSRSSEQLKLTRRGHLVVYHNYTQKATLDAEATTSFYVDQEIVPHYQHIIQQYPDLRKILPAHSKRALIISPNNRPAEADPSMDPELEPTYVSWAWMRTQQECPLILWFCFADEDSQDRLEKITESAFAMWKAALGDKRGIDLMFTKGDAAENVEARQCYETDSFRWGKGVPPYAVVIALVEGSPSYNGLGCRPGSEPGRMKLRFWPDPEHAKLADPDALYARDMAHEIGHVMGLHHEHQRPDADTHVEILFDNVVLFDSYDEIIDTLNKDEAFVWPAGIGGTFTASTAKYDYFVNRIISQRYSYLHPPPLIQLLPIKDSPFTPGVRLGEAMATEVLGPFDWDSIMLYGSGTAGFPGRPTMRKKSDQSTFEAGLRPSAGDVAGVKRMYPDTPEAWGAASGASTSSAT